MRECKVCKLVKFDWQFYKKWFCCPAGCVASITNICKKCAKDMGDEAVEEKLKIE